MAIIVIICCVQKKRKEQEASNEWNTTNNATTGRNIELMGEKKAYLRRQPHHLPYLRQRIHLQGH